MRLHVSWESCSYLHKPRCYSGAFASQLLPCGLRFRGKKKRGGSEGRSGAKWVKQHLPVSCCATACLALCTFLLGVFTTSHNGLQFPFYMKNHSGMCASASAYACIASGHAAKSCTWSHHLLLHLMFSQINKKTSSSTWRVAQSRHVMIRWETPWKQMTLYSQHRGSTIGC